MNSGPLGQNMESASRSVSTDQASATGFEPYVANGLNGLPSMGGGINAMNGLPQMSAATFGADGMLPLTPQQLQYQAYLQPRNVAPTMMYPAVTGTPLGGYAASPSLDNFRGMAPPGASSQMNPAPMMNQANFGGTQFSPVLNPSQIYPYPPFYQQSQPVQNQSSGGRRGRR
jgi:protein JSN1